MYTLNTRSTKIKFWLMFVTRVSCLGVPEPPRDRRQRWRRSRGGSGTPRQLTLVTNINQNLILVDLVFKVYISQNP